MLLKLLQFYITVYLISLRPEIFSYGFSHSQVISLTKREAEETHFRETEDKGGGNSNDGLLTGKVLTEVNIHLNGSAVSVGNKELDEKIKNLLEKNMNMDINYSRNHSEQHITVPTKQYSCIECADTLCKQEIHCLDAAQCFQAHLIDSAGTETFSRGCIQQAEKVPFICATSYKLQNEHYTVKCCEGNFCNNQSFSNLSHFGQESSASLVDIIIYIVTPFIGCIILLSAFALMYFRSSVRKRAKYSQCFSKKRPKKFPVLNGNISRTELRYAAAGDSALREMFTESLTSGSGSGLPLFVQRTLAKNISLENMIGKGRYGEVWKGIWQGEHVAVKIFSTRDESYWAAETEIYSSILLRHENILGFYGSDMTSSASCTQLWFVTCYHPQGSLHDYLGSHTFDYEGLFTVCWSVINGLVFLHTEIMGNQGKPAIAHRDISSKNVLMKEDGTCCISDLGLAVLRVSETGEVQMPNSSGLGNKRYMSPEILDQTLNMDNFDSFRKADIYAVSIVMWEAISRTVTNGVVSEYELPFANLFSSDPSNEEMRCAICSRLQRPLLQERWKDDRIISSLVSILMECWHQNPCVRLTALRIKKNLCKIASDEMIQIIT